MLVGNLRVNNLWSGAGAECLEYSVVPVPGNTAPFLWKERDEAKGKWAVLPCMGQLLKMNLLGTRFGLQTNKPFRIKSMFLWCFLINVSPRIRIKMRLHLYEIMPRSSRCFSVCGFICRAWQSRSWGEKCRRIVFPIFYARKTKPGCMEGLGRRSRGGLIKLVIAIDTKFEQFPTSRLEFYSYQNCTQIGQNFPSV